MNEQHSAKYSFYYLLSLVSLIFIGISVGLVAFGIINKSVIDPLSNSYYRNYDSSLRFAISAILIATPIYYYSLFLIKQGFKKNEISSDSSIRKWLTYFIILVSSLIILGVFISVMNNFLSGGLSLKFILQALSVFIISALVFSFYFYDVKSDFKEDKKIREKIFLSISLLLIVSAFVSAWFFIESPKQIRARKIDGLLLNRISTLESFVNDYYSTFGTLPENMTDLKTARSRYFMDENHFINPNNGEEIVYNKINKDQFEFCASFETNSFTENKRSGVVYPAMINRDHEAGYNCLAGSLWVKEENRVKELMFENNRENESLKEGSDDL